MSEYETEYRMNINREKQQWEIIRWDGEDHVVFAWPYGENSAFNFKEAKEITQKIFDSFLIEDDEDEY